MSSINRDFSEIKTVVVVDLLIRVGVGVIAKCASRAYILCAPALNVSCVSCIACGTSER